MSKLSNSVHYQAEMLEERTYGHSESFGFFSSEGAGNNGRQKNHSLQSSVAFTTILESVWKGEREREGKEGGREGRERGREREREAKRDRQKERESL